jgi:hypothetical protein
MHMVHTTTDDDDIARTERALTIKQFCAIENISKAKYYEMRRAGLGPEETIVPPGGTDTAHFTGSAQRVASEAARGERGQGCST